MNIQIKKYIDPIKNFWAKLTQKKKIIILSIFGGIVLLSILASVLMNIQPYVVLYPGLEHEEAVEVMTELKDRGISYKEDNGTIYVPKDKENALRMDLSNAGHPKTAPNYDFFTKNISIMSTDFEKKTIEKYQLNQRLETVIKTIKNIQNANVTISIPDSSGYAWDENAATSSASVTVQLVAGKTLEASQVNGIKQLISKSVPNLKVDDVVVIDTATGNELSSTDSETQIDISQFKLTIEKEYENDIETKVLKQLTPVYGVNNVKVTAKSIMDIDKKVQEIITYKPSTTDNKGVISDSNVQKEQETGGTKAGGTVGTQTNSDVSTYPGVTVNGDVIYTKDAQTYKYLVSQVKEQIQSDAATVQNMTISVVINKELMSDTEKTEVAKAAAFATAILPDKVAVFNSAFPAADAKPTNATVSILPISQKVLVLGGAALLTLFLVLMVVFIVIGKKRKKKQLALMTEEESEILNEEDSLKSRLIPKVADTPQEAQKKIIEEQRAAKASQDEAIAKEIQEFSSQNPEIAAQLIRTWLRGDNEDD